MNKSTLQDRIDDEIKSGSSKDLMTPEERAYFCTLTDDKEMQNFVNKIFEREKLNQS